MENKVLKKIKSGKHFFLNGTSDYYKVLNNFINESIDENENILLPRALILFENREQFDLYCSFILNYSFKKGLVVCQIHDKKDKIKLRNDLYNGVDIVVGTIKSVAELYLQNGISLSILKLLYIELESKKQFAIFSRLIESMKKGQLLIKCDKKLQESILDLDCIQKEMYDIDE